MEHFFKNGERVANICELVNGRQQSDLVIWQFLLLCLIVLHFCHYIWHSVFLSFFCLFCVNAGLSYFVVVFRCLCYCMLFFYYAVKYMEIFCGVRCLTYFAYDIPLCMKLLLIACTRQILHDILWIVLRATTASFNCEVLIDVPCSIVVHNLILVEYQNLNHEVLDRALWWSRKWLFQWRNRNSYGWSKAENILHVHLVGSCLEETHCLVPREET